jgi:oligopeptide transport system ATP-binding protein
MIALALACNPKLLIADEPTTALDVTVQAQILDLMKDLKDKIKTSIILITHDLGVVAGICSRVAVMYAGTIIEIGTVDEIFYNPVHPYTWGLLKSVPRLDEGEHHKLSSIEGQPPDLFSPPKGCAFAARCEFAMKICKIQMPEVISLTGTHNAACWLLHPQAPKTLRPGKEAMTYV